MRRQILTSLFAATAMLAGTSLHAQQAAPPISTRFLRRCRSPIRMAHRSARRRPRRRSRPRPRKPREGLADEHRGLRLGANLVAFLRMDGAQLASISISEHKARVAVEFRRPSKALEDGVAKAGLNYLMTLDDVSPRAAEFR